MDGTQSIKIKDQVRFYSFEELTDVIPDSHHLQDLDFFLVWYDLRYKVKYFLTFRENTSFSINNNKNFKLNKFPIP